MARTKEQKPDAAGMEQQKPVDIQNDEHRGMGGSYVFDPDTGKRTRADLVGADSIRPNGQPATDKTETEVLNNEIQ